MYLPFPDCSTGTVNHEINRLRERGLGAFLNDETLTFKDTLSKSNDTTIYVKNIQRFMIEFCKYLYGLSVSVKQAFIQALLALVIFGIKTEFSDKGAHPQH